MYRELAEEVGLEPGDVSIIGCTKDWLRYRLPKRFIRRHCQPLCIGQKQIWYLLHLIQEEHVRLDRYEKPEFDCWRWVSYWRPLEEVVPFKRNVYSQALSELSDLLFPKGSVPVMGAPRLNSVRPTGYPSPPNRRWETR